MFSSEAVTRGIRVKVSAQFSPEHSSASESRWFFYYTVEITNEGAETAQLISRHWVITNGCQQVEEVKGLGVVGKQPILHPGQTFSYTSGCPLTTSFGTMHGSYQMVATGSGEQFDVQVAPFTLSEPYTVH